MKIDLALLLDKALPFAWLLLLQPLTSSHPQQWTGRWLLHGPLLRAGDHVSYTGTLKFGITGLFNPAGVSG